MRSLARVFPAALAMLLLAAHFFRDGWFPPVVACLALLALLLVPRSWAARTVQVALSAGVVVWLHTAWRFAAERRVLGVPSARLWVILGAVAAFTALAAWLLEGRIRALRAAGRRPDPV